LNAHSQAKYVTGRIYLVIEKREKRRAFRKTVQVVPHITNEIKRQNAIVG
jgi:CTP synthase (UTP-ammonia lyase)